MRTIAAITVARSDYGIYRPVLKRIQQEQGLRLRLLVSGMHPAPEFGLTSRLVESEFGDCVETVEMLLSSDSPEGTAKSMGLGMIGFGQLFRRSKPDLVLALGDRFEMFAAVAAALPFGIPVAHIHGGELTQGAMDDSLRHAITKLSHLHFVATEEYARRVVQLGEEPWRVTVSGAPGIDNLTHTRLLSRDELLEQHGVRTDPPPLLVTFHPVTLEPDRLEWQVDELLAALDQAEMPVVFTLPNADAGNSAIRERIAHFVGRHSDAQFVANLGTAGYFGLMAVSAAMVGNSSSGIIEAPSLRLPVVNLGSRQAGRVRGDNVIDAGHDRESVLRAIREATSPGFRSRLTGRNPYGDGHAAEAIARRLREVELGQALLVKRFHDQPSVCGPAAGS